jgi:hypothetical protein
VDRRAPASVTVRPDELAARASIARRCYQKLLESKPSLAGEIRLELAGAKPTVAAEGKPSQLSACAISALGQAMVEHKIANALVTFEVTPQIRSK